MFNGRGPSDGSNLTPQRDSYAYQNGRMEYQLFSSEYFSGADVKIYFGDIWVDEVTNIAFQMEEQVLPIFGYNSYTYDAIARGRRLISGNFTINFTSVGYLNSVIEHANAIQHAIETGEKENVIAPKYYENKKLSEILEILGKESFEQIANEYEQAIWGNKEDNKDLMAFANKPYFRQNNIGFDIRVQYGAVSETEGMSGKSYYQIENSEKPNITVETINGVQLNGFQKINVGTNSEGAPIQEAYSFIARDLNGLSAERLRRE